MSVIDAWLDDQHILFNSTATTTTTSFNTAINALDSALNNIATAVAALRRAGRSYALRSEDLWTFAAGTWSRSTHEHRVTEAARRLPEGNSVHADVALAVNKVKDAVAMLRRYGDVRDARELEELFEMFMEEGW